ncbi:MAG: putative ABC transporter ATP-binding protein YknY [Chlamydiales bacterium]|nr:putative ABC transporter ATP-binding protein YknY [Chlamydiales bacterium]MCH9619710.1 putative ABC transporter ATP-binding protein YknY [Chlamydiales bacterium]MCH9623316.1 putative ABC transporter ATP-binding protein YknY [Chlamydiales bacterium]
MKIAVNCKNIIKTYGDEETKVHALRGINLEALQGELLMLVGPSGCGKTTLLSIISAIMDQDSGMCEIFGEDITVMSSAEKTAFRGRNIGFIFQSLNLIPTLTSLENTAVPLILDGVDKEEALQRAEEMLGKVGLHKRAHAYPPHMSGGEQQRVAVCRGCIHRPKLVVCDEPTSALDHKTGVQVMELFKEIVLSTESTLIVVTHDSRIYNFADRILRMDDGQVVETIKNHH